MSSTFLSLICLHGITAVVELGYEYEFTLSGWMLSKIINKLVGRRNTGVCEIEVTTYSDTEYGARKSGADRGDDRLNLLS